MLDDQGSWYSVALEMEEQILVWSDRVLAVVTRVFFLIAANRPCLYFSVGSRGTFASSSTTVILQNVSLLASAPESTPDQNVAVVPL
jgi:hypothetical protein